MLPDPRLRHCGHRSVDEMDRQGSPHPVRGVGSAAVEREGVVEADLPRLHDDRARCGLAVHTDRVELRFAIGAEEVRAALDEAPIVRTGDHLHRAVGVIDVVEGHPRGDECVVGRDGVPARPVLVPSDRRLRRDRPAACRAAGPATDEPTRAPISAAAISPRTGVGGERRQVGVGPPGVVDLAQVARRRVEGQCERRALSRLRSRPRRRAGVAARKRATSSAPNNTGAVQ